MFDTTKIELLLSSILLQNAKIVLLLSANVKEKDLKAHQKGILSIIKKEKEINKAMQEYNKAKKDMEKDPIGFMMKNMGKK